MPVSLPSVLIVSLGLSAVAEHRSSQSRYSFHVPFKTSQSSANVTPFSSSANATFGHVCFINLFTTLNVSLVLSLLIYSSNGDPLGNLQPVVDKCRTVLLTDQIPGSSARGAGSESNFTGELQVLLVK